MSSFSRPKSKNENVALWSYVLLAPSSFGHMLTLYARLRNARAYASAGPYYHACAQNNVPLTHQPRDSCRLFAWTTRAQLLLCLSSLLPFAYVIKMLDLLPWTTKRYRPPSDQLATRYKYTMATLANTISGSIQIHNGYPGQHNPIFMTARTAVYRTGRCSDTQMIMGSFAWFYQL